MQRFELTGLWADPQLAGAFGQVEDGVLSADADGSARLVAFVTLIGGRVEGGVVTGTPPVRVDALLLALAELGPLPWPDTLRRTMPRVLARATSFLDAAQQTRPLTITRAPADDYQWEDVGPLLGVYHRLAQVGMDYTRFDGTRSDRQLRDVLVVGDAALMLPYDAQRDRVLLVEQIRPGLIRRGDPQPWILEPVAGLVDAGESAEATALRELHEEAGLDNVTLLPTGGYYPSPGGSSEYFHGFIALTDLPDSHPAFGGLLEEAEDLRLHIIPFDQAMAAMDSGEINAGPLQLLLLQLARKRDALRRDLISTAAQP
ncbi:NUDIX domain-containing protein [Ketogulonicigenium vulgare]|uniref:ADP-ribose pyrophosphatase n=1 Tax=Ketogulonicigenium vulgare (strain WSH-001) TaxID=759362 RepID=F9Y6T3_KETVW|nr:NUDIX hydrolase [Ketogulonicigenium vulgare]ADO42764.1 tellurite resistance protein TrgB [Ketogulonicigenium vulgare Y25]AEM40950.1 Nudix hydrolase, YffH family, putative [Ketogulonicigenium vulgare WSH-001]ALJ81103.1 NUDIX hydrolase [Ketogulonicigenium vulgare]ANW33853.1 NUDIX hydrolase [Ketogulonicigenium vulgare]AOZ54675.1 tellurite resistance protein TrgB [Ketogulonicigenium vulgare]